jgi:hypothetical protein
MYLSNLQNAYCRSQISFSQRHKNTKKNGAISIDCTNLITDL